MIKAELIGGRLTDKQIIDIVKEYRATYELRYETEEFYLKGENTKIKNKSTVSDEYKMPQWKIPVSYGRKIIKTVTGYMYKPGLISEQVEDTKTETELTNIYKLNEEPILNQSLGTYQGTNGIVYELNYIGDDGEYELAMIKASEGIAIYDYSIKPQLKAFIRYYKKNDVWIYEVYYDTEIIEYEVPKEEPDNKSLANTNKLKILDTRHNIFGEVPIVIYRNNENDISDIQIVKELIDAYDVIVTDGVNEVTRFAWAYLLIFGMKFDPEDLQEIKESRAMQDLPDTAKIEFLTRDIPGEFMEALATRLKHEIHRQSFIPDIDDIKFSSGASGVAINKFIYLMEFIAADKQAYFESGLRKRLRLIEKIKGIDPDKVKIIFKRNEPESDSINADIYVKYDGRGISRETLMENFAPFVEDPEKEMEKSKEESEANMIDIFEEESNDNARNENQTNRNTQEQTTEEN